MKLFNKKYSTKQQLFSPSPQNKNTNHKKHTKISYEEIYDDRFFHSYFL